MIFEVLLPYGFLLEYNDNPSSLAISVVLLPYGFLLEYMVLCQEKVQIKYALLMLSYPAKASALSSNAA